MDDLDTAQARAFDALREGATSSGSAWRHFAMATSGTDGRPKIRTLVLRAFDATLLTLDLHTDLRSAKVAELRANPAASLHAWNASSGEQLRIEGLMSLHTGNAQAQMAWQSLRPKTRDTYRVGPAPGTPIERPDEALASLEDAAAFAVFAVLRLRIEKIEYLLIDQSLQRRARFTWAQGTPARMWLVP